MTHRSRFRVLTLSAVLITTACGIGPSSQTSVPADGGMLVGAWRSEAANSSPPAHGVWKQTGARTFQTKYVFYTTQAPGPGDGAPHNGTYIPKKLRARIACDGLVHG